MTGLSRTALPRARRRLQCLATICLATVALTACTSGPGGEQQLVDRAALTVQDMMTQNVSQDPKTLLTRASSDFRLDVQERLS